MDDTAPSDDYQGAIPNALHTWAVRQVDAEIALLQHLTMNELKSIIKHDFYIKLLHRVRDIFPNLDDKKRKAGIWYKCNKYFDEVQKMIKSKSRSRPRRSMQRDTTRRNFDAFDQPALSHPSGNNFQSTPNSFHYAIQTGSNIIIN